MRSDDEMIKLATEICTEFLLQMEEPFTAMPKLQKSIQTEFLKKVEETCQKKTQ